MGFAVQSDRLTLADLRTVKLGQQTKEEPSMRMFWHKLAGCQNWTITCVDDQ